jgi:hypothetical protein
VACHNTRSIGSFSARTIRAGRDFRLSDGTWADLAATYNIEQLIELPMLVGHYHLVAMTLNSLGVQLDEGLTGFPA